MRFAAALIQSPGVATLCSVTNVLQKSAKPGEKLQFKLSSVSGIIVKFHRLEDFLFVAKFAIGDVCLPDTWQLESIRQNEILLEIDPTNICAAFRASKDAHRTLIHLTKRQGQPVLSFRIELPVFGEEVIIVQDCPVTVLKGDHLNEICEPTMTDTAWSVELPSVSSLQEVANRMRYMGSNNVTVQLTSKDTQFDDNSNSGTSSLPQKLCTLHMKTDTPVVSIHTRFEDCILHSVDHHGENTKGGCTVAFRLKHMQTALQLGIMVPHEFSLARITEGYGMFCYAFQRMPDSHATCSIWPVIDER